MRKLLFLCLMFGAACKRVVDDGNSENVDLKDASTRRNFKNYIAAYKKGNLRSNKEVKTRFQIFSHNSRKIQEHNKEHASYRMNVNAFSDKTVEERKAYTGLGNVSIALEKRRRRKRSTVSMLVNENVPEAYDHRDEGHVTKVTNQGECGSCWTYSTVYCIEGELSTLTNEVARELSQQQILSCTYETDEGRNGCDGGWYFEGWDYVKYRQHLTTAGLDPYLGVDLTCEPDMYKRQNALEDFRFKDYVEITPGDDEALKAAASQHVLAIAVESLGLFFYSEGLFEDEFCFKPARVDHAVTMVGYSKEAWIIKNSWGEDWGEKGYVRMSRQLKDHCGISDFAYYSMLEKKQDEKE